jgi:4-amino-4-deoxy-L-arabinose transferase-like glycosyltransferase
MNSGYVNRSRVALLVAFGLFLLTRTLALTAFPIFNDEAIYLQYSQRIHDDWNKNKFISMNGEFTDWKPPLQYWMTAPFIELGNDPLVVGRIVSCLVSITGFFGIYLFSKELFTEREGVFAAFLYVLCPPVLLHNDQFTAETFLLSMAPLFYWAVLKAIGRNKPAWIWLIVAAFFGTALLLFKQSGFLLLAVSVFLPLARFREDARPFNRPAIPIRDISLVIGVIVCSYFAATAFLPSEFHATRERFDRNWVLSASELVALPTAVWRTNLGVVADYIGSYYSWIVALFFCAFVWLAFRRRNFAELILAAMCAAGGAGIILLLRGFNEYLFNTAIIAALLPLLGRMGVLITDFVGESKRGLATSAVLLGAAFIVVQWGYQDVLMSVSPGKYIERSSRWAKHNYLESWSTGFGVQEIVLTLEKEKRPGIVFADTQWGNPRTALEVYGKRRFPNLRIEPVTREFLDPNETRKLKNFAAGLTVHFAIYSADSFSEMRRPWQANIENEMCETRREVKAYPSQMPIVVCQF